MMRHKWFAILLLCFPIFLHAGSVREDSLLRVIPNQPNDSNKVDTYNELFKVYFSIDSEKALYWGNEGLKLAEKLDFHRGIAKMCNNLGVLQSKMGNYAAAQNHYRRAYEIRTISGDSLGMAICLSNIGSAYYKRGMYPEALDNYGRSMSLFVQKGDTAGILGALNNIGSIYNEQGKFEEALNTYFFVMRFREQRGDRKGLAQSQYNVGSIYHRMGMLGEANRFMADSRETYMEENDLFGLGPVLTEMASLKRESGDFEAARKLYREAIDNAEVLNDRFALANCSSGLALVSAAEGDFKTAESEMKHALEIYRQIQRPKGEAESLNLLGSLLLQQNRPREAIAPLRESLALARTLEARDLIRDNYHLLAEAEAAARNYREAYEYFLDFFTLHDSIYSQAKSAQYAELNARYRAREQQLEIQRLNLQREKELLRTNRFRQRNLFLLTGLIIAFILALTFYLRYRQKQRSNRKIERMNHEIQAQRDRMKAQNDQIREINTNLERIIDARTAAVVDAKNELDTFLYESAHALRRPLTRIEGLSQLMDLAPDPESKTELRDALAFTIKGMDRLLHKLIMVNENEQRKLEIERLDAAALVKEVQHDLEMGNLAVSVKISEGFELFSDRYLMRILLVNLLENAAHFCADPALRSPHCQVRFSQSEDFLTIEVEDNGLGVAEDHLPQLFEMFYRAHNHNGSNGLGLYVVSKVVDRLHGEVDIESVEHEWTRVRVRLPRHFL